MESIFFASVRRAIICNDHMLFSPAFRNGPQVFRAPQNRQLQTLLASSQLVNLTRKYF